MNFIIPNFSPAIPEIFILSMACLALVVDLFLNEKNRIVTYILVQFALIGAIFLTLPHLGQAPVVSFNGNLVNDQLGNILEIFIFITTILAFHYSRQYVTDRNIARGEYYVLGLFSVLGMMVLVSAHSLLTIYLGIEVMTLPLYAMVALQRDNANATEAAMKYFVMGAIASGMLLYGMSMLYGATGSIDIATIATSINNIAAQSLVAKFALVFIMVGIGFKFAAVPFHMWVPDVYTGAPSSDTLFLGSAPKLAALGMASRLLLQALPALEPDWQQMLILLSILSMGFGNLLAISQTNIKRMFSYSAIAHMGYMSLGLLSGTIEGDVASLFYMLIYAIMSVAAFGMIVLMSKSGFEAENIDDFKGLNQRNPWLAFMMLIIMFSMAGIPPTVGFFAKLGVLKALISADLVWLAVLALIFAIIGAFFYISIVRVMYFETTDIKERFTQSKDMTVVMSVNALALLALGIFPSGLIHLCRTAFINW